MNQKADAISPHTANPPALKTASTPFLANLQRPIASILNPKPDPGMIYALAIAIFKIQENRLILTLFKPFFRHDHLYSIQKRIDSNAELIQNGGNLWRGLLLKRLIKAMLVCPVNC